MLENRPSHCAWACGRCILRVTEMAASRIPSYENPPLTEVAVGVALPPNSLQTRHIGEFWSEIRAEYPITEDNPPIPPEPITKPLDVKFLTIPPLRRVFMMTPSKEYVIQIQEGRFLHNWRRFPAAAVYPRFQTMLTRFLSAWEKFSDFARRSGVGDATPSGFELTYVNELDDPAVHNIPEFVKSFEWPKLEPSFLKEPPHTANIAWTFVLPDSKGVMNVSTNRSKRPDGRAALLLVLSCVGPASASYSLHDWFETAHQWIVHGFTDLTTPEAHRLWKREV
jgi:uncharacterized protein (TIGR04255 family)